MNDTIERNFLDMPVRISHLPRDARGFPVPKFVWWRPDGTPDFRVIRPGWMTECVKHHRCWLCGGPLGRHMAFVIGPMCCINRVISEPPSHYECALFAAKNCPFLTKPLAKRREAGLPEQRVDAAGVPILRNPGVCCVWITRSYKTFSAGRGNAGMMFAIGEPERTEFFREGRHASRAEVEESVRTGLPLLLKEAEKDGPEAVKELHGFIARFGNLMNTAFPEGVAS